MTSNAQPGSEVTGEFVAINGERYYAIRNVDKMAPFFISVVSSDDHWMFVSSTGGLSAGRVAPGFALFPYVTDDKIHESTPHTGTRTLIRVRSGAELAYWEPFNQQQDGLFATSRTVYKSVLGNKLCFEEINHDLELAFRYTWANSESFGFVRTSQLENIGDRNVAVDIVDGLQNMLPAGTPAVVQTNSSNLVNAYKWTELDEATGLALLTLYSGITDRAEPCESLRATTVFSLGLSGRKVLLSSEQLQGFRAGRTPEQETFKRGIRGAYFLSGTVELPARSSEQWQIVADLEQSQGDVAELRQQLQQPGELAQAVTQSVEQGSAALAHIMARADGFQVTADETESVHHYANVLFNVMRGGNFHDQYLVTAEDFAKSIKHFNEHIYQRNQPLFDNLPERLTIDDLLAAVAGQGDAQLERLAREYLPLTFGRRHGDPSRPWNHFEIKLKDEHGDELLTYQGNWRDIFQNWEALTFSYPGFIESVIAKFVNASTVDGYNPYRISNEGIDWEVEEPDDPWSYIGYWGDHQIIYLEKLLEASRGFNPNGLRDLLRQPIFSYANVPYRIKGFADLVANPKDTVEFDAALASEIERRVDAIGADGKLILDADGEVYQVNLLEKLLVPLLAKLGNLVVDGGIWLNTQRPEWNDANNALVGYGLSVVTLCYMRRYVDFLQNVLRNESDDFTISAEVSTWFDETAAALQELTATLNAGQVDNGQRYSAMSALGLAASRYRDKIYSQGTFTATEQKSVSQIVAMLNDAQSIIDQSIEANRRDDGLFHSYNLLDPLPDSAGVDYLYPMLEGQVAALSSGKLAPDDVPQVLDALFASAMYREDQRSFMLYPDRSLPSFLDKNRMSAEQVETIRLLKNMLAAGDDRIVYRDADGWCRFNADITNAESLRTALDELAVDWADDLEDARRPVQALYEEIFQHRAFTGRSGTMFGYEGLGSIYWHMVSKLLLAVQENYFAAVEQGADAAICKRLGELYYQVRRGIGFNKTPIEYGAFPTDPYSHTPKHAGAQQPGMTGQVKEEVLSRFGELGVCVNGGTVTFRPNLLRKSEFLREAGTLRFLDIEGNWQELPVSTGALAFTWCQVPVVYQLADDAEPAIAVTWDDGKQQEISQLDLPADISSEIFRRSGRVRQLNVRFSTSQLLDT